MKWSRENVRDIVWWFCLFHYNLDSQDSAVPYYLVGIAGRTVLGSKAWDRVRSLKKEGQRLSRIPHSLLLWSSGRVFSVLVLQGWELQLVVD